eukprot:TRINITY_DN80217_c0_g1_i1.p1 TRINITY_DN80217_c0_g1~~TRINITY_DN80217_c0_g1_i1.p1  ORF type:complete len:1162 (+),score=257.35 TRINITY_DN80217_c0_g1_i1:67-3552(+)
MPGATDQPPLRPPLTPPPQAMPEGGNAPASSSADVSTDEVKPFTDEGGAEIEQMEQITEAPDDSQMQQLPGVGVEVNARVAVDPPPLPPPTTVQFQGSYSVTAQQAALQGALDSGFGLPPALPSRGLRQAAEQEVIQEIQVDTTGLNSFAKSLAPLIPLGGKSHQEEIEVLNEMRNLQGELDTMKVETMHNMINTVELNTGANRMSCNVLYLTNKQAASLNQNSMDKVRTALDIQDPKMVIRLMPSRFGTNYWQGFPYYFGGREGGRFPTKKVPEVNSEDRIEVEHRMTLLIKEVLLPLAIRNHALVVGLADCALMNTFIKVSAPIRRQMGDGCPFQLLQFSYAYLYQLVAEQKDSHAAAFKQQVPAWSQVDLKPAMARRFGDDRAFWPQKDFFSGSYSTVLFECLQKDTLQFDPAETFQNDFISSLATTLPVIGIQTYGTARLGWTPAMADHVNRGLPLMLLDSRKRVGEFSTLEDAQQDCVEMMEQLHEKGISDSFNTSLMANVKTAIDFLANREQTVKDEDAKRQWIWQAIENKKNDQNSIVAGADAEEHGPIKLSKQEMFEQSVVKATNFVLSYVGKDMEWESTYLSSRCGQGIDVLMEATSWPDLKKRLDEQYVKIRSCCFHKYDKATEFCRLNPWAVFKDMGKDTFEGRYKLMIDLNRIGTASFDESKKKLVDLFMGEYMASVEYDSVKKSEEAFINDEGVWLAVYEILKSNLVYSGNLHSLKRVEKQLFAVAKIDRLPMSSTLEGLILLRRSWTLVDLYHKVAAFYKKASRIYYVITLSIGIAIVAITVLGLIYPDALSDMVQQRTLLALALIGSFLTGCNAIIDPTNKWMQLRGGALVLESEIWKYRTRIGAYGNSESMSHVGREAAERRAETLFQSIILSVQDKVLSTAGMKETTFYSYQTTTDDVYVDLKEFKEFKDRKSKTKSLAKTKQLQESKTKQLQLLAEGSKKQTKHTPKSRLAHGQYQGTTSSDRPGAGCDTHHAPATPHEYIRWRLVPMMNFYQGRIPTYSRKQRLTQVLLVISTVATAMLAALKESRWSAIVAAVSGAIAAWQEFSGFAKKLERYSTVANALQNILMWWQALPEVDQSSVKSVEYLVHQVEGLVSSEHMAWMSDVQQAAKMASEASKAISSVEDKGSAKQIKASEDDTSKSKR